MAVNNSANINNTNNHISPQHIGYIKRPLDMTLEIYFLAETCGWAKLVNGIPTLYPDRYITLNNTYSLPIVHPNKHESVPKLQQQQNVKLEIIAFTLSYLNCVKTF